MRPVIYLFRAVMAVAALAAALLRLRPGDGGAVALIAARMVPLAVLAAVARLARGWPGECSR